MVFADVRLVGGARDRRIHAALSNTNESNRHMSYEIKGVVRSVSEVKQVTEKFAKRELILEVGLDSKYPQVVQLESSGDRNALLDPIGTGDSVTVQFDLRGREGRDGRVWNTLSIWKIAVDSKGAGRSSPSGGGSSDELPF